MVEFEVKTYVDVPLYCNDCGRPLDGGEYRDGIWHELLNECEYCRNEREAGR